MGGTSGTSVSLSLSLCLIQGSRLLPPPTKTSQRSDPDSTGCPASAKLPRGFDPAEPARLFRAGSPLGPPKRGRFPRPVPLTSADDVLRMGGVPEQTTSHMFQGTGRTGVAKLVSLAKCLGIGVLELTPRGILQQ